MALTEFSLIARYFTRSAASGPDSGVVLGIGDDAALLAVRGDRQLAVAIDTLVEGVHFPADAAPGDIAHKALAVNLSDLAAMGAEPRWFTLALTLPAAEPDWLEAFAHGLFVLADEYGIVLIGGDTTRGPLCVTVQVAGEVPTGEAMTRHGAMPGDGIYITGTLGDAALGLALLQQRTRLSGPARAGDEAALLTRLHRPIPRVQAGLALRGLAHAAIDVSDGLVADLGHILAASGTGATVDVDALPRSPAFRRWEQTRPATTAEANEADEADEANEPGAVPTQAEPLALLLGGGDDYELCLCLPAEAAARLDALEPGVALTRIGTVEAQAGLRLQHADGQLCALPVRSGYAHF